MHNTFVVAKPDRNYGYPWWHYFVTAAAQSPYLGACWLTGGLSAPSPDYPYGFAEPVAALRHLTLIGRGLSLLLAAAAVVGSYLFAAALFGRGAGLLAALLVLANPFTAYYARTGNLDVPAFGWTALGLAVFARIWTAGLDARRGVALGALAGLAMATKDQSVLVFAPVGALLLLPSLPAAGPRPRLLALALAASVGVYAVATALVVDPARHWVHVRALVSSPEEVTVYGAYHPTLGAGALAVAVLQRAAEVFGLPVLLAAAAGLARAARRRPRDLLLATPLALLVLGFLPAVGVAPGRYFLPFTALVDAFAAHGVMGLRATRLAGAALPVAALLVLSRALPAADLAVAQLRDTRGPAAAWLETALAPGDRVEYFGPPQKLPRLPAEVDSRRVGGRSDWRGQQGHGPALLDYLRSDEAPSHVILVPDWTSAPGADHSGDCPPEVRSALADGSAGYREVARFDPPPGLPGPLGRPRLDHPDVAPPVRVFARAGAGAPRGAGAGAP